MSGKTLNDFDQAEVQRIARDFVGQHIKQCATTLVWEISQKPDVIASLGIEDEINELMSSPPNYQEAAERDGWRYDEQKDEFFKGEPDYRGAAESEGWEYNDAKKAFVNGIDGHFIVPTAGVDEGEQWKELCDNENIDPQYEDTFLSTYRDIDEQWKDLCEDKGIEPDRDDIYEHWIATDWFASKMQERHHGVEGNLMGLTIWGRPCSGQAIYLDDAVQQLAMEQAGLIRERDEPAIESGEDEQSQDQGVTR